MIVTVTQIQLKNFIGLLRFIPMVINIRNQLAQVDGLKFVKLKGLRTLTGWENMAAMQAFRNNGHHLVAMKNIRKMGKAKSITWETDVEPEWTEAILKLQEVGF